MGIPRTPSTLLRPNFLYWLMQSGCLHEVFADRGDTASNIQTLEDRLPMLIYIQNINP